MAEATKVLEKKKLEEEKKRKELEALDTDSMGSDSNHGSQGQFAHVIHPETRLDDSSKMQTLFANLFHHADNETIGNAIYIILVLLLATVELHAGVMCTRVT